MKTTLLVCFLTLALGSSIPTDPNVQSTTHLEPQLISKTEDNGTVALQNPEKNKTNLTTEIPTEPAKPNEAAKQTEAAVTDKKPLANDTTLPPSTAASTATTNAPAAVTTEPTPPSTSSTTLAPPETIAPTVQPSTMAPAATNTSSTTAMPVTTEKVTEKPTIVQARGFDGASFIGGIILTLGLIALGFVGFKYYKNTAERNYHTL